MNGVNASSERDNRLVAEKIALVRGGLLLFENLSFDLSPGGALLIMGRNGAGKSSLLRALAAMLPIAAGRLHNPFTPAWAGSDAALKPERTVRDELRFWAGLDGAGADRLAHAAERMAIEPLLDLPVAILSSGQRQRVSLARVITSNAPLWLLDEPTNALDDASCARLFGAIAAHCAQGGMVIAATHQPLPLPDARVLRIGL